MKDLSPSSFGELFERLLLDRDFAYEYNINRYRRDTGEELKDKDIRDMYCYATETDNWKYNECMGWSDEPMFHDPVTAAFNHLINPWVQTE